MQNRVWSRISEYIICFLWRQVTPERWHTYAHRLSFRNFSWMTRFLSNTLSGELTPAHEAIAKEVLRAKCLVGLLRDKAETMRRLNIIFKTKSDFRDRRREEECQDKLLFWDWPGKNRHDPVVQGSEAWNILYKQNTFDLRLYDYAQQLFEAQGKLFIPSSFQQ